MRWLSLVLACAVIAVAYVAIDLHGRSEDRQAALDEAARQLENEERARRSAEEQLDAERARATELEHRVTELQARLEALQLRAAAADAGQAPYVPFPPDAPCPSTYAQLLDAHRNTGVECTCGSAVGTGSVWGSSPYTQDSSLCRAALHAGAIDARGGRVVVRPSVGCQKYVGSQQHGVATHPWSDFPASFHLPGFGSSTCPAVTSNECPATFAGLPKTPFECTCDGPGEGPVYGTDVYTPGSSLCSAAVHAGVLNPAGGAWVGGYSTNGCMKYVGSRRNGIVSADSGPERTRWAFFGSPETRCDEMPRDVCPQTFDQINDAPAGGFSCTCVGDPTGMVWGSDIYTRDSSLCAAALHAGSVAAGGGRITVWPAPACGRYAGSTKNGVTTRDWGEYRDGSFVLVARAVPCVQ